MVNRADNKVEHRKSFQGRRPAPTIKSRLSEGYKAIGVPVYELDKDKFEPHSAGRPNKEDIELSFFETMDEKDIQKKGSCKNKM